MECIMIYRGLPSLYRKVSKKPNEKYQRFGKSDPLLILLIKPS